VGISIRTESGESVTINSWIASSLAAEIDKGDPDLATRLREVAESVVGRTGPREDPGMEADELGVAPETTERAYQILGLKPPGGSR